MIFESGCHAKIYQSFDLQSQYLQKTSSTKSSKGIFNVPWRLPQNQTNQVGTTFSKIYSIYILLKEGKSFTICSRRHHHSGTSSPGLTSAPSPPNQSQSLDDTVSSSTSRLRRLKKNLFRKKR